MAQFKSDRHMKSQIFTQKFLPKPSFDNICYYAVHITALTVVR